MQISLATSLHLDHGAMTPDHRPGDPLRMQAFVPLGLLSLKAAADGAGLGAEIRVAELNGLINAGAIANDDDFYEHVVDAILAPGDDLVGLMTDADSLHHTILIAQHVKRRLPDTLVCLGGPASSPISRPILEAFPCVDMVVRGEGELTFNDLIGALNAGRSLGAVHGLTWRQGEEVVSNADRPLEEDLDRLPIPDFEAYDMAAGADLYLDVGRGCPFKCEFCATAPFWNRRHRMKTIDRIVDEMTLVRDAYGRSHVNFSHDIFTANRRWTHEFCQRLVDEPIGVTWTCSTRTDISQPELLEHMAAAGCVEIYFGIESGSPAIQKAINKNLDLDWSRQIIAKTAAAGIRPIFGFIVGYPIETEQTLRDTLARLFAFLRAGGVRGHLFTLCPFQEAPMYRQYGETATRPAADYRPALTPSAASRGIALQRAHRRIFSSAYRYETPGVPERLVDASEEISASLTVLRSLWPLLLEHYGSELDWYERWVDWIERANAERRPQTPTPLQGTVRDLLAFVSGELVHLGLAGGDLDELVRYETLKLDAAERLSPAGDGPGTNGAGSLHPDSIVARRCDFLALPFRHDVASLLAARRSECPVPVDSRWVVCAKTTSDRVDTMQVGAFGRRLLELAGTPRPAGELVALAGLHIPAGNGDGMTVVSDLVRHRLLEVTR